MIADELRRQIEDARAELAAAGLINENPTIDSEVSNARSNYRRMSAVRVAPEQQGQVQEGEFSLARATLLAELERLVARQQYAGREIESLQTRLEEAQQSYKQAVKEVEEIGAALEKLGCATWIETVRRIHEE